MTSSIALIFTRDSERYTFEAHGLDTVTGTMGKLEMEKIKLLFPGLTQAELRLLQRRDQVDYLIGYENPSWHPSREVKGVNGGDFWLHRSRFGSCVGGSHPSLKETTTLSSSLFATCRTLFVNQVKKPSIAEPDVLKFGPPLCPVKSEAPEEVEVPEEPQVVMHTKTAPLSSDKFFQLESLGTPIHLKCQGCVCGKCPIPGSRFSFKEQWQLDLIKRLLHYDADLKKWTAELPWIKPRDTLPNNYGSAAKALESAERNLRKNPGWGEVYGGQVHDMVDRNAAVKLSREEAAEYKGTVHYIPHLIVLNPGSKTTPVRLVFDASRPQPPNKACLNDCLAKGPDNFVNNLCGVLITFRTPRVAAKGDITKFYNAVGLVKEDAHCQRFLWRDMESREPDIYMVVVNNIGIKPSGTIATAALELTADRFAEIYPDAARDLVSGSYVDDIADGANDLEELKVKTKQMDVILDAGGMKCKSWIYSFQGDDVVEFGSEGEGNELQGCTEKVLGMVWVPKTDEFKYYFALNLGTKKGKVKLEPDISKLQLLRNPPLILTRRIVLSQVAGIFDPLSLLTPVILQAKILIRRSWNLEHEKIGWDDPLPAALVQEWVNFFILLYEIGDIRFDRSLTPQEKTVGDPWLVIFSDGALASFGACAYVRWRLENGGYWCRLVMSKGRIAPKCRATIPRMELSGATLQVRMERFIKEKTQLNFVNTCHLVDSSTVLGYLHKDNGAFKPYEGVRIAEIQSGSVYKNGLLQCWGWINGADNPADLTTKPVKPTDIGKGSVWQDGPAFLYTDVEKWPVKTTFSTDVLEGEIVMAHAVVVSSHSDWGDRMDGLLERVSRLDKLLRVTARVTRMARGFDQNGARALNLGGILPLGGVKYVPSAKDLKEAKLFWVKRCQLTIAKELRKSTVPCESSKNPSKTVITGQFKRLAPMVDADGVWRVGSRMRGYVPFTDDKLQPILLPYAHKLTALLMEDAHRFAHGGQDVTLSKFRRNGFWTPQGGKMAKRVRYNCVGCRIADAVPLQAPMGPLPVEDMMDPVAWGSVELDLMGPLSCRGEKNPRSTVKVWGIVMVDKNSQAVHSDIVIDYSACAVIAALRRFGSVRGWPASISSDPGSQLVSAGGKLEKWWETFGDLLQDFSGRKEFTWKISPANSPWRQGRAERRIGQMKRLMKLSLGETRVTPSELQTCLMEAASIINDTPISLAPPRADGTYPVITANNLLIGRSGISLPDDCELAEQLSYKDRYRVINQVTSTFWSKWISEVTPKHVSRKKWHSGSTRELQVDDLVLVADKTAIKAKYRLAVVTAINGSSDGKVRSAELIYYTAGAGKKIRGKAVEITRSIQRLSLILAKEEQEKPLSVIEDHASVTVLSKET